MNWITWKRISEAKQMRMPSVIWENRNTHRFLSCCLVPDPLRFFFTFILLFIYLFIYSIIKYQHAQLESSNERFCFCFKCCCCETKSCAHLSVIQSFSPLFIFCSLSTPLFCRHSSCPNWLFGVFLSIKQRNPCVIWNGNFRTEKKNERILYGF